MRKPGFLDEVMDRLGQAVPPGATELKADFERNARNAVQGALSKMDLVTREEFDIQAAVLQRTREKLERLEKLVEALEADAAANPKSD